MRYDALIFDLDGTILNTLPDLTSSVNYALDKYGFPTRSIDEVRTFIGNGVGLLIKRSLPDSVDDETVEKCLLEFKAHYQENFAKKTVPYDKITDVLTFLKSKGIKIGVVSNKFDLATKALCKKFFNGLIDYAVGEIIGIPRKPDPTSLLNAINTLEVLKQNVLYLGDSEVDIQTAKNAGVDLVSVSWGFKDQDFLIRNGAKKIINEPIQILNLIKE